MGRKPRRRGKELGGVVSLRVGFRKFGVCGKCVSNDLRKYDASAQKYIRTGQRLPFQQPLVFAGFPGLGRPASTSTSTANVYSCLHRAGTRLHDSLLKSETYIVQ